VQSLGCWDINALLPAPIRGGHPRLEDTMQIELSEAQGAELQRLLESALGDLSSEIADTDNAEYRQGLRDRRSVLESVLSQLDNPPAHPSD
jgi:hypothetical protein